MIRGNPKLKVIIVLAVLIGAWAGCHLWSKRINDWPITNPGSGSGPVVCFGDSLVAGVGAKQPGGSYPEQLADLLGRPVKSIGIPGETAEDGLIRLRQSPEIRNCPVVITLGGNDLLRRVPWNQTAEYLEAIFQELQARGCLVAYTGIEALGGNFKAHKDLCRQHGVILIPDLLGGIANQRSLKSDQIHPNDAGYRRVAEKVAEHLTPFLH